MYQSRFSRAFRNPSLYSTVSVRMAAQPDWHAQANIITVISFFMRQQSGEALRGVNCKLLATEVHSGPGGAAATKIEI